MQDTDHEITGFRFISRDFAAEPQIGDALNSSFVWDGDKITETELAGTCCFETRAQIERYAKYSAGNGWIVTVGGDFAGRNDDFVGEILVGNAIVLEVAPW